ncbi:Transmembrane protease serine 2 [Nymphon striatum]|nr:Transmembrane protease serine 2 [Nymphon striatum]
MISSGRLFCALWIVHFNDKSMKLCNSRHPSYETTQSPISKSSEMVSSEEIPSTAREEDSSIAPSAPCNALEIQSCYKVLPYTSSGRPNLVTGHYYLNSPSKAKMLERLLVDTASLFRNCHPDAEIIMCMIVYPKCQNGRLQHLCRSTCQEFVESCKDTLNEVGVMPHCELLPLVNEFDDCMDISSNNTRYEDLDERYPQIPGVMETLHLMLEVTDNLLGPNIDTKEFSTLDSPIESNTDTDYSRYTYTTTPKNHEVTSDASFTSTEMMEETIPTEHQEEILSGYEEESAESDLIDPFGDFEVNKIKDSSTESQSDYVNSSEKVEKQELAIDKPVEDNEAEHEAAESNTKVKTLSAAVAGIASNNMVKTSTTDQIVSEPSSTAASTFEDPEEIDQEDTRKIVPEPLENVRISSEEETAIRRTPVVRIRPKGRPPIRIPNLFRPGPRRGPFRRKDRPGNLNKKRIPSQRPPTTKETITTEEFERNNEPRPSKTRQRTRNGHKNLERRPMPSRRQNRPYNKNRRRPEHVRVFPPPVIGNSRSRFEDDRHVGRESSSRYNDDRAIASESQRSSTNYQTGVQGVQEGKRIIMKEERESDYVKEEEPVMKGIKLKQSSSVSSVEDFVGTPPSIEDSTFGVRIKPGEARRLSGPSRSQLPSSSREKSAKDKMEERQESNKKDSQGSPETSKSGEEVLKIMEQGKTTSETDNTSCRRINLRICRGILPYKSTSYPNMVNHQNERQLRAFRRNFRRRARELKKCHKDALLVVCAMLQPKCSDRNEKELALPCPNLCADVKNSCSRTLREMYLYPDCNQNPDNSCMSLEDLKDREDSPDTNEAGISLLKLRNSTITTKSGEPLITKETFEDGKLKEPLEISVLLPYSKPKNREHDRQPETKEELSRQLEYFQVSEGRGVLTKNPPVSSDRLKSNSAENGRRSQQKGPVRSSDFGTKARTGSKVLPKPSKIPDFQFTTRFPFPKVDDSKERDSNDDSFLGQQSREVEVVLPQVIKPIRIEVPTKSKPELEPVIYNAKSIASVSFGTKIENPKAYLEIRAKPGYLVEPDFVMGKKIKAERPPVRSQTKQQGTARQKLTSYAARAIDFEPIRAALLKEQQKLLQELNIQQRVLSKSKYAKVQQVQSPAVLTTENPIVITPNNPNEYSDRISDNEPKFQPTDASQIGAFDTRSTSTESPTTIAISEDITSGEVYPTESTEDSTDSDELLTSDNLSEESPSSASEDQEKIEAIIERVQPVPFSDSRQRTSWSIETNEDGETKDGETKENCTDSYFQCKSGQCLEMRRVCDDVVDCEGGDDEETCASLSEEAELIGNIESSNLMEGFLMLRQEGEWYPVCADLWDPILAPKFCKTLKFRYGGVSELRSVNMTHYVYYHEVFGSSVLTPSCYRNEVVYLQCRAHMACPNIMKDQHPERICDGTPDCRDFSDEINCRPCNYDTQFLCMKSQTCIGRDKVCDGVSNCKYGEDEQHCRKYICLMLSKGGRLRGEFTQVPIPIESSGYLMVRKGQYWHQVCSDSWIPNLSRTVCNKLSYKNVKKLENRRAFDEMPNAALTKFNRRISARFVTSPLYTRFEPEHNDNQNCSVVHITCQELVCSEPPQSSLSEEETTWPWLLALNAEGTFRCPAILIDEQWAISSSKCVDKDNEEYLVMRSGTNRLQHYNPYEQVAEVNYIAEYNSTNNGTHVALLHFYKPLLYTSVTWPICLSLPLPTSELSDCVVVGWDHGNSKNKNTDYKNERVTIVSNFNCGLNDSTDEVNICVQHPEKASSENSCQDEDYMMLLCRNSEKWNFVGIESSTKDNCQSEYSSYTRVSNYSDWIDKIKGKVEEHGISFNENPYQEMP